MQSRRRRFQRLASMAAVGLLAAGISVATVPFARVAGAQPPGWSSPVSVDDSSPVVIDSVSCPTATFCAGVNSSNQATIYNGSTWSAQTTYEGSGSATGPVSCVSSTFCVATDSSGHAIIYNGLTWASTTAGYDMSALSCVSTTFCMGVTTGGSAGDAVLYNGATWTATSIDAGVSLWSVSCPTTTFCIAFDNNGNAFIYNGATWTSQGNVDSNPAVGIPWIEVSCTVTGGTLCAAVDGYGFGFHYNGVTWTADGDLNVFHYFTSVSCASASFCAAVDSGGATWTFTGTGWTGFPPEGGHPTFTSESCPQGGSFCMAVDNGGTYFTTSDAGGSWFPHGVTTDSAPTAIYGVSCATSAFCVTGDSLGNTVTYGGDTWASPESVDDNVLTSLSCPTPTFCAAVDDAGQVVTYSGTTWAPPLSITSNLVESVSCASADLCVAVDTAGNALLYNGSSWTDNASVDANGLLQVSCAPGTTFCAAIDNSDVVITTTDGGVGPWTTSLTSSNGLSAVSCATADFCVVASQQSGVGVDDVTTDGGVSWSGPSSMDTTASAVVNSVSCPTSEVCVAVDSAGNVVLTSDGATTWSTPVAIDTTALASVSCASPTFCVAVDNEGNAVLYTPPAPVGLYVSKVSPFTGLTSGNTAVTISGSGFTTYTVNNVYFGTQAATNVHVVDNTTITADSPPESAGTVDVTVATTSGTSAVNSADRYTYTVATGQTSQSCTPNCSLAESTPLAATTVLASGTSSEGGATLNLSVNAGILPCPGTYDYTSALSDLSTTDFAAHATVTVTETIGDLPSTKGVKVCFAPLSASTGTFLSKCHTHVVAPCISSLKEQYGHAGVVTTFVVPANDPRFWTGDASFSLTSFSPTHGAPGSTVTIKGKDLSGSLGVAIGGATAAVSSTSTKSKLKVTVPQGAHSGFISVTAASGQAVSTEPFTVT